MLPRRYRALLWCLALSLAFHFTVVPFIVSLLSRKHPQQIVMKVVQAHSSALTISRRPRPQRNHVAPQPHKVPQSQRQPVEQTTLAQATPLPAPPPRRELARIEPRSPVSVPRVSSQSPSSGIDLTQQQAVFEKTIARLRREDNPVLGAAQPVQAPAAAKPETYNYSGAFGTNEGNGILEPVKSWHDGPYDYYYVHYWVQYADGVVETGYVPWPLRYLPREDPFLNHWDHFPLPKPLPDYRLPPGMNLHPLIAFCLEHLKEVESCPPQHD